MSEAHSSSCISRRTWLGLAVPVLLVAGYYGIKAGVRGHVDSLVQQSVGKVLPDFRLVDDKGEQWSPERLFHRRVLLHFFRSRCGNCNAEAAAYRELEVRLPADVVLLHVMTDVVLADKITAEESKATIAREAFTRPVVMADAAFVDAFHHVDWANVTPITYVVDRGGRIRFGLRGRQTVETLEAALAATN